MSVKINIGYEVRDFESGGTTEHLPLRAFKYNLLISGRSQLKKADVLSHIINQFHIQAPDIGVLLVKLDSTEDLNVYQLDKVYEYGDPELQIPYFWGDPLNEQHREKFENYLNSIFGFHYEMKAVIGCVIRSYKNGRFPSSVVDFLEDVKNYLAGHPYGKVFDKSNTKSIEKTISYLGEDPILERILWRALGEPEWLRLWGEGKVICIDLSLCSGYYQKILVALLFQAIQNYIPMNNSTNPIGIVALDPVDNIFKKVPYEEYTEVYSKNREYYDQIREVNYFLTKEQIEDAFGDKKYLLNTQLEKIFNDLVHDELRYRNISLITTCHEPSNVYPTLVSLSQTKIKLE